MAACELGLLITWLSDIRLIREFPSTRVVTPSALPPHTPRYAQRHEAEVGVRITNKATYPEGRWMVSIRSSSGSHIRNVHMYFTSLLGISSRRSRPMSCLRCMKYYYPNFLRDESRCHLFPELNCSNSPSLNPRLCLNPC